jgi:hypothetical protein
MTLLLQIKEKSIEKIQKNNEITSILKKKKNLLKSIKIIYIK